MANQQSPEFSAITPTTEYGKKENLLALLASNDNLPSNSPSEIFHSKPDGTLVAVGMGMSLRLVECFDQFPKEIVLFDINAHVVVAGRIFIELLKENPNFDTFQNQLIDKGVTHQLYQKVINDDPFLKQIFDNDPNIDNYYHFIQQHFDRFCTPNPQKSVNNQLAIATSVKNNYHKFHQLAKNGDFNIYPGDLSNRPWVNSLGNYLEQRQGKHLIYISNIPDYIFQNHDSQFDINQILEELHLKANSPLWLASTYSGKYMNHPYQD